MNRVPKQGQLYRHFKNKLYQIVAVASHTETGEQMVIYQALYGTYKIYARPLEMFTSEVDHEKYPEVMQRYRFELVELDESGEIRSLEGEDESSSEHAATLEAVNPMVYVTTTSPQVEKRKEPTPVSQEEQINPDLLAFLDAQGYKEKIEVLQIIKKRLTSELLHTMGLSLDFSVGDGDLEDQYQALMFYLETHARYEGNRLR